MNVVDILISIVVVTILVTIILAVVTYVAYKLRLAREPASSGDGDGGLRYFVRFDPVKPGETSTASDRPGHVAGQEGHAPSA